MIGNDIIDISLAKTQSNWQRPGFLEKQFTNHEIELIRKSVTPFLMVWRMWSMKEAAYKVVVQQEHKRFFAPKKFECQIASETEGLIRFKDRAFESTTRTTGEYIYTYVGNASFQWIGQKIDRKGMLKIIRAHVKVDKADLKVEKNAFGVPELYKQGRQISRSVTITHHGKFEAFEYKLI